LRNAPNKRDPQSYGFTEFAAYFKHVPIRVISSLELSSQI